MAFLTQTVAPTTFPVSLADMRAHLRVDGTDEDDYIEGLISAASRVVQERTGKALGAQTWVWKLPCPSSSARIRLPLTPVTAVTAMAYQDTDDVEQTLTVADFWLFQDDDRAFLEPKDGNAWPSAHDRIDAVAVTFTAGFGTTPANLVHAIKLLAGHWFENRTAVTERTLTEAPDAVDMLINLDRVGWVA